MSVFAFPLGWLRRSARTLRSPKPDRLLDKQPEPDWRLIKVAEDLQAVLKQLSRVSTEVDRAV